MSTKNLFLLPRRFLESERVLSLLDFMENDVDDFFAQIDNLYSYISIDDEDEDYIKDVGQFIGIETLKFKYSEENQVKAIKNYFSLIKFIGGIRAINTILMTYSFPVEVKYLWTNDWITFVERSLDDIIYGYGQEKYLSSYFLVRFNLKESFVIDSSATYNELLRSLDLDDSTYYYKNLASRVYETNLLDVLKGKNVYKFHRSSMQSDRIEIWDKGNDLDSNIKALAKMDLKSSVAAKYRVKTIAPALSEFPHAFWHDYSNELSDPEDFGTVNWTKANGVTVSDPETSIFGFAFSRLTCDGTAGPSVAQICAGLALTGDKVYSIIVRNGNLTTKDSVISIEDVNMSMVVSEMQISWDDKVITDVITGQLIRSIWLDSSTAMILSLSLAPVNVAGLKFIVIPTGAPIDGEYIDVTAAMLSDDDQQGWFPYLPSGFTVEHNVIPVTLRNKITFDIEFKPEFSYDQDSQHCRIFGWRVSNLGDNANALYLYYNRTTHKWDLIFRNDEPSNYPALNSLEFDDGSSYLKLNQWIRIVGTLDLTTGDTTGSQMYTITREESSFTRDDVWSADINVLSNDFINAELGRDPGTSGDSSKFKGYIRKFDLYDNVFTDVLTDEVGIDAVLASMTKIYSHYNEIVGEWSEVTTADEWSDQIESDLDLSLLGNARMAGIEIRKEDESEIALVDTFEVVNPSLDLRGVTAIMEEELYSNLRADVSRLRMVHQVFSFESKLEVSFLFEPVNWEHLFGGVWIWKNPQYTRTTYTSDSGLEADAIGLVSDSSIESVLDSFDQVVFGSEAYPKEYGIMDVEDPFHTMTGSLEGSADLKVYKIVAVLNDEIFDYVNELAVRDSSGNVLFYLVFPNWYKTNDQMVFEITMDYSGG